MPAAHCVSTLEGIILNADHGFLDLLRRSEAEVVGCSYKHITDPRDLQRSAQMLTLLEDGAAPVRLQKRYLRPDGSSIAANLLVTRFSNPDRLISTLFWQEKDRPLPPARLWAAALRLTTVLQMRKECFGSDLGNDPIGFILLCVYLAEAEGRSVSLEAIASSAGLPLQTAGRWIKALQGRGLLEIEGLDAASLQLTQAGLSKMEAMLAKLYDIPDDAAMLS